MVFATKWPLTVRPGLSQGGWASHMEARPLTGRLCLSQSSKNTNKNRYNHKIFRYQLCVNCKILDFVTRKIILLASQNPLGLKRCSRVPALSDSLDGTLLITLHCITIMYHYTISLYNFTVLL